MKLTLVKLGGSLITNKSKPLTLREDVLTDVIAQIARAINAGHTIILGHGSGSFAHVPAEKYQTIKGKVDYQSVYGAAVVEDAASQLNRIVVSEALKQSLPAISLRPFDFLSLGDNSVDSIFSTVVRQSLHQGFLPVTYGDVVMAKSIGFTILSTERILNILSLELRDEFTITKVIHCGETDGFLVDGRVIDVIDLSSITSIKEAIHETAGFDVTGGMWHKVEESMFLAKQGIDSYIVGGNHGGNLYRCIVGDTCIGTKVTA